MMHPGLAKGLKYWRAMVDAGFALLCLRFLISVVQAGFGPAILVGGTALGIGWWRPTAAIFALAAGVSLLSGLEKTVLLFPILPLVASSVWLGLTLRKISSFRAKSARQLDPAACDYAWIDLSVNLLATMGLWSVLRGIHRHAGPDFWSQFWQQPTHATGNPFYFLTAAFLWLNGLFYFRSLREPAVISLLTPAAIRLVLIINGAVLTFFFAVQWGFNFPTHWTPGFQSPFEDIAAFGAVVVCLLIFTCAQFQRGPWLQTGVQILVIVMLVTLVAVSWSRGTWLAGATYLLILGFIRLPRPWAAGLLTVLLGSVVLLNLNGQKIPFLDPYYAERVASLIQYENLTVKHAARVELYVRAWRMIKERPWLGHGIGSFFRDGTRYSRPQDPNVGVNALPHNILLHLASEQGVPIALLFTGLMAKVLWMGLRAGKNRPDRSGAIAPKNQEAYRARTSTALALTLMLAAYLQTNLTWDLLLVHSSQPFFFWFLFAGLGASLCESAPNVASGRSGASP